METDVRTRIGEEIEELEAQLPALIEAYTAAVAHQEVCYRAEAKAWGAKTRDTPRDISGHAKAMRDLEMASRRLFGTTDRLTAVQKKIRILRSEATAQERIRTQEEMFA